MNLHGTLDGVTHLQNTHALEARFHGHQEVHLLNTNSLPHFFQ